VSKQVSKTKKCSKCEFKCPLEKVSEFFYRRSDGHGDGFQSACKQCRNTITKSWAIAHPERAASFVANWAAAHPSYQAEWVAAHPERQKAAIKNWQKKHPLCFVYSQMMQRCYNPNATSYKDYGGRGITVCPRWHSLANFEQDMPLRPKGTTLDRINNDGNYEPGNVRWATPKEQAQNRRNGWITRRQAA
jgi:hypothetical protein